MGWLDKYEDGGSFDGLTDKGFNYNGAWGGQFAMGGSLPGSVGFTYARTGSIPSNGPHAKKTMASAQTGKIINDNMGQWAHPGEITRINSNDITMQGVGYPVLGISDKGDKKLMQPGMNYKFKGNRVTEIPLAEDGSQLKKLDQLTNFTNYNTPQPGGWLDKYNK
jgi:hypothetical protein